MKPEGVKLYQECVDTFSNIRVAVTQLLERANADTLEDLVDLAYVIREATVLIDECRKEMNQCADKLAFTVGDRYVKKGTGDSIKTQYCSCTPDVKQYPPIPKRSTHPELYSKMCEHFGIPKEVADLETFRPHWPGVCEYFTKEMEEGRPIPNWVDLSRVYTKFVLNIRKKKDITS